MHNFCKTLSFIAVIAFVFVSCTNDIPDLPTPEEVEEFMFCKSVIHNCKSTYEVNPDDCVAIKGSLFFDMYCSNPVPFCKYTDKTGTPRCKYETDPNNCIDEKGGLLFVDGNCTIPEVY